MRGQTGMDWKQQRKERRPRRPYKHNSICSGYRLQTFGEADYCTDTMHEGLEV